MAIATETQVGKFPGERPNRLRPDVPLMYEAAHGRESHLKSRTAMLGETLRPIQQRKTGGGGSLQPNWRLLSSHMYTDWPGIHSYEEINDRLFVNPGRNDNIQDTSSKAKWYSPAHLQWVGQQEYMWQFVDAQVPPVRITMEDTLAEYRANLKLEEAEIAAHSSAPCGRKKWKTKEGIYQLKDPEKLEQDVPTTDYAIYADMLRDV